MDAFAAAVRSLFDDPNLSRPALFKAGGVGAGVSVRVVWRAPDDVSEFGQARVVRPSMRVEVPVADVADPALGDTVEVDGEAYVIAGAPQRDGLRLVWTLPLRPASGGGP